MLKIDESIRNSLIVASMSEWIWEYDLLTKELDKAEALINFLGYDKNEVEKGVNFWLTLIHTDDIKALLNALNDIVSNKTNYFAVTYRIKSKHAGYKYIRSTGKAFKNEYGNNIYMAGYSIDISEQVKIQRELSETTERNKKIIELSPLGVYAYEKGVITYVNESGLKLFGAKCEDDIIGKCILDFVDPCCRKTSSKRIKLLENGYKVNSKEINMLKLNGDKIICDAYSTSVSHENETEILSYIKDITEQKRMTEENKKLLEYTIECDRVKTEFFSNISHDLRTPLNIILSSIQLLNYIYNNSDNNYNDFTTAFEKYINIMKQNSYRLLKLINNIIDISKLDSGFLHMNFSNHNIVEIVENITLSVADYIENNGINLIFDTDTEEKIIACDADKIERIILNLLSNAVKYTKSDGTIKVDVKNEENAVLIIISDTGCGIPSNKLESIFERFRQVDEELTSKSEGSGIGLSLVKALVEAHGGIIKVCSTYGVGSTFTISLPNKTSENIEMPSTSSNASATEENFNRKVHKISIEFSDIYS
ncbi:PAS domain S-box protein [Clostridium sp. PL3]|uniref:histidine kinase n=1 Tax=Clostridium thailandense TaxID=2794346 RepID=A0A949TY04_9CLOT|nr:ATP-binding protein [Clostridium thailandense]MBV7275666.1 PAS domain S-box protein [Clostridium thailandense]